MAEKTYTGAAPYTLVRTGGSMVGVHRGNPVPQEADRDDVARLVEEGYLIEGDLVTQPESTEVEAAPAEESDDNAGTVKDVLAEVGDDPDKALAALEAEKASDKPRATLVGKLEAIVEKATDGES